MNKKAIISNVALILALGSATVTLSACSLLSKHSEISGGSSTSGVDAYRNGDYKTANAIFAKQYAEHPNDLYALENLADSYSALGDYPNAVTHFQKLAATGKSERPQYFSENIKGNPTFTDLACYHLKQLSVKDANCT